ncbi:MAG: thioredoxin domain-containing protein [Cyanobacteria bacterium J06642_12]
MSYLPSIARRLVVALVAIACCFSLAFSNPPSAFASSLLSGFAALKQAASSSVPYGVAAADSKPVLIEFYADWCSVCRAMAPTVAELHDRYGEQVNFVMLDIDEPQWAEQVREFRVVGVPYFAFVSSSPCGTGDRQVLQTLVGKHPNVVMVEALERLLSA